MVYVFPFVNFDGVVESLVEGWKDERLHFEFVAIEKRVVGGCVGF